MSSQTLSIVLLISFLVVITGVFVMAFLKLGHQLEYVKELASYLGDEASTEAEASPSRVSLTREEIRNQVKSVREASKVTAGKLIRGWQQNAQRLEVGLAFHVDLLRQLGLLGTVLGLGISLEIDAGQVTQLLAPLALAIWTTVAGLVLSIALSWRYTIDMAVWADTCEKNIEEWVGHFRQDLHHKEP